MAFNTSLDQLKYEEEPVKIGRFVSQERLSK